MIPMPARAVVLDTETTGFSPKNGDRIVEVAAVEMIDGQFTGRVFHSYVNPARAVPAVASNVHGLTTAFLRDKPAFSRIAHDLAAFLGDPETELWAHSASFDSRFLLAEMGRLKITLAHKWHCSLKLAKRTEHGGADDKLETLAALCGYRWGPKGAHSALEDAHALSAVLAQLLWPRRTIEEKRSRKKAQLEDAGAFESAVRAGSALPTGYAPDPQDVRLRRYDDLDCTDLLHAKGKRWTALEEQQLIDRFAAGDSIEALVGMHGRSPTALFIKLAQLGAILPGHPYEKATQ